MKESVLKQSPELVIVHRKERQVAVMPNSDNLSRVLAGAARLAQMHSNLVSDGMGIACRI